MLVFAKAREVNRTNFKDFQRFIDFSTRQINARESQREEHIYKTHDKFISVHKFHNYIEVLKYK